MCNLRVTSILLTLFLLGAGLVAADSGAAVMKDGKKGEIHLAEAVKVGDVTLSPGYYIVQHRVHADEHLMHFVSKADETQEHTAPVNCAFDPKSPRWRSSSFWVTIKDGQKAIEKVMIKGEKIVYNFQ